MDIEILDTRSTRLNIWKIEDENVYQVIDLSKYLSDTQISKIWLHRQVIIDIHEYATKSLEQKPVREVGGFFLGNYKKNHANYGISIDQFVPSTPKHNSPVEFVFGAKATIELENVLNKIENKNKVCIGWFHTHPGHTPYLSNMDMTPHEGLFKEAFQIAVVLDSLTVDFDTGFFTRKQNGQVNNHIDFDKWIGWKNLNFL
ncbi:MAG: hypothetical protein AB8G11_02980 [Saprospiraceae bacterium]